MREITVEVSFTSERKEVSEALNFVLFVEWEDEAEPSEMIGMPVPGSSQQARERHRDFIRPKCFDDD